MFFWRAVQAGSSFTPLWRVALLNLAAWPEFFLYIYVVISCLCAVSTFFKVKRVGRSPFRAGSIFHSKQ